MRNYFASMIIIILERQSIEKQTQTDMLRSMIQEYGYVLNAESGWKIMAEKTSDISAVVEEMGDDDGNTRESKEN